MIQKIKNKIYSTSSFSNYNPPKDSSGNHFVEGLKGSLKAFFLTHLVETYHKSVVFLTADLDSAEKIRDDLEILIDKNRDGFCDTFGRKWRTDA